MVFCLTAGVLILNGAVENPDAGPCDHSWHGVSLGAPPVGAPQSEITLTRKYAQRDLESSQLVRLGR